MSGNRLLVPIVVLAGLLALTVWQWNKRDSEDSRPSDVAVKLPKLKKDDISEINVNAPGKTAVTLKKVDTGWKLTAPVNAEADKDTIDTALAKLEELEVVGVAATKTENHALLDVTDAKGVHVVAKQADKTLIDLVIGSYGNGTTMVLEKGAVNVASVKGSIKYAFDKDVKDWRDKIVVDAKSDEAKAIAFTSTNGSYKFVKEGSDWKQAPGEKPIANFDGAKVSSIVSTVTGLRAVDFPAEGVTADAAGVGSNPVGTIALTVASDAGESQTLLRIGNKLDTGYYVQREGKEPIFIVAAYSGERLLPTADKFAKDEPKPAGAAKPAPGGLPPGIANALKGHGH